MKQSATTTFSTKKDIKRSGSGLKIPPIKDGFPPWKDAGPLGLAKKKDGSSDSKRPRNLQPIYTFSKAKSNWWCRERIYSSKN